ncbi:MAG: hypothetical protein ACFE7A_03475, partial [Promethearchaeota archaeon]
IRSEELSVITVEMPPEESLIEASEAAAKEVSPTRKRTTTKKRTSKRGQKKTEPGTRKRKRKQKRKTKNTR